MKLRPYQNDAVEKTLIGWDSFDRQLIVMPTGGGKTIVFSNIVQKRPGTSLVLAHRKELINQARDKLVKATGIHAAVEMGKHKAVVSRADKAVVSSVQTMHRRLGKWPPGMFQTVIIDEAHRTLSKTYTDVIEHFCGEGCAKLLGVTATPNRGDNQPLERVYQNLAFQIGLFDLVRDGFLANIVTRTIPFEIDLSAVSKRGGDFKEEEVGMAIAPFLQQIAEKIIEHSWDRKTLIFVPLVKIAEALAGYMRDMGVTAECVSGNHKPKERDAILKRHQTGKTQYLINSMLLTEGYDDPSIDCVIPLRATASQTLYSQMVGRGTRIHPGKDNCMILDFLWNHEKHQLCTPACLVAHNDDVAAIMNEEAKERAAAGFDEQTNLFDALDDSVEKAQARLAARMEEERKAHEDFATHTRDIDMLAEHDRMRDVDGAKWEPDSSASYEPISAAQRNKLVNFGYDLAKEGVHTKEHANYILGILFQRSRMKLASPKQVMWLRRTGHPDPEGASRIEASNWLDTRWGKRGTTKR